MRNLAEALATHPIIAAVRDLRDLDAAVGSGARAIFLLTGTVFNLAEAVAEARRHERIIYVHFDLLQGVSKDAWGMRYVSEQIRPDGVISTRTSTVGDARAAHLATIQRLFLLDSHALQSGLEMARAARPDFVELLPGIVPTVVQDLVGHMPAPIIAGGLVRSPLHCRAALRAGAIGVSTSTRALWACSRRQLFAGQGSPAPPPGRRVAAGGERG